MNLKLWVSFFAGLVFGIGLIVAGMTNPSKVIGFLDLAVAWHPSLAFVMVSAILVGLIAFRLIDHRPHAMLGGPIEIPTIQKIDRRLVGGALIFGVGWGLAGYCPGPAVASLANGGVKPLIFTMAMLIGTAIFEGLERLSHKQLKQKGETL